MEIVVDSEREERPMEISTQENEILENIVKNGRRITTRELAECLSVLKRTITTMLLDLGIGKLCF